MQLNEAKSSGVKRISDEELATYTDSLAVWRKVSFPKASNQNEKRESDAMSTFELAALGDST